MLIAVDSFQNIRYYYVERERERDCGKFPVFIGKEFDIRDRTFI